MHCGMQCGRRRGRGERRQRGCDSIHVSNSFIDDRHFCGGAPGFTCGDNPPSPQHSEHYSTQYDQSMPFIECADPIIAAESLRLVPASHLPSNAPVPQPEVKTHLCIAHKPPALRLRWRAPLEPSTPRHGHRAPKRSCSAAALALSTRQAAEGPSRARPWASTATAPCPASSSRCWA